MVRLGASRYRWKITIGILRELGAPMVRSHFLLNPDTKPLKLKCLPRLSDLPEAQGLTAVNPKP